MQVHSATIIYFSPTDATKKIINAVAKGMNIAVKQQIDLTSPKVRNAAPPALSGEIIFVGVPVYALGIPGILAAYLANLRGSGRPAVLITVYGNIDEGIALNELHAIAKKSGFKVIGAGSFVGEHSFSTTGTPIAENRPDSGDLKKAEAFGHKLREKVQKTNSFNNITMEIPSSKIQLFMSRMIPFMKKVFRPSGAKIFVKTSLADMKSCTHCGLCVNLCPMGAIDRDTLKINNQQCLRCCSCVKRCPRKARKIIYRPKLLVTKVLTAKSKAAKEPKIYL
jgi:Heterodisulfide reductase, subunit A and related polyferredoxins